VSAGTFFYAAERMINLTFNPADAVIFAFVPQS